MTKMPDARPYDIDAIAFTLDRWSTDTNSPSWETVEVGFTIKRITYHEPMGEGDAHYCDVFFTNGNMERYFRPRSVVFRA